MVTLFEISKVYPHGAEELLDTNDDMFKINSQGLKPYWGEVTDKEKAIISLVELN